MSRLTKDIREQMARKLVNHRYADEAKALVHLNRTLAERAYNHCYTKQVIEAMEVVNKAFPLTFKKRSDINVNAGGFKVRLGNYLSSNWVKVEQAKDLPARMLAYDYDSHNLTDEKLIEEVKDYATRWRGFDDVCKTAYHEALSVLNTLTTGKKLAEAWPEAIPVIGDLIPEGERTLPVVQVAAINAKFKLPPEVSAAGANKSPEEATKK